MHSPKSSFTKEIAILQNIFRTQLLHGKWCEEILWLKTIAYSNFCVFVFFYVHWCRNWNCAIKSILLDCIQVWNYCKTQVKRMFPSKRYIEHSMRCTKTNAQYLFVLLWWQQTKSTLFNGLSGVEHKTQHNDALHCHWKCTC